MIYLFRSHELRPNQALKLTRLSVCQLGGSGFVEGVASHRPCTSSAVQLDAGVGPLSGGPPITLSRLLRNVPF